MNRQLLGLTGAFVASVAIALPSPTATTTGKITAKQAALKGVAATSDARPERMVSRLIVKLRSPTANELVRPMSASRMQALSARAGIGMKSLRAVAGGSSLIVMDAALPLSEARAVAARLALDAAVEYAEPDIMFRRAVTPNDTRFNDFQWNLLAPTSTYTGPVSGQPAGTTKSATSTGGANLPLAWDVTIGHSSAVLAVIDTGIVNHQDLNGAGIAPFSETYVPNGRFLAGYDFISEGVGAGDGLPANFVANDGNGRDADASDPGDWITAAEKALYPTSECVAPGETAPFTDSRSSWHGSHMAGIAAAMANNASGIAGIGWNLRILPVRALGKCGGSLSDIAEAIRWAAGLSVPNVPTNTTPARVINLSLGGGGSACPALLQSAVDAAIAAGSVVVAATGNESALGISAPANCTGVIAVTAHTINGENAVYANIGPNGGAGPNPTISAAGGGEPTLLDVGGATDDPAWFGYYIWSTILFGNTTPSSGDNSSPPRTGPAYGNAVGTSAATPQVAAVAALIKSMIPSASPAAVRSYLVDNVSPHPVGGACTLPPPGFMGQCGPGLLDANAAVRAAALVAPLVVFVQPQNASAFEAQTATFSVDATGAGPITYQWLRNGTPISGANSASYTTPALTIGADNGSAYSVVITNSLGTVTTSAATLAVAVAPPPPPAGAPPPTGGGGGGGTLPFWQLLLLGALSLAARVRIRNQAT